MKEETILPGTKKEKILLVDDHPPVRDGLALLLENQPGLEVCGKTGELSEALRLVAGLNPDLVIVDLSLKRGHGLDLIKRIKSHYPAVKILVWSMHPENLYAKRVLNAGALGYIQKEDSFDYLIATIRRALKGESLAGREASPKGPEESSPLKVLSDRELETFELLGKGLTTNQIADKMLLSPKTVETYRSKIKDKLHVTNNIELLRLATLWCLDKQ